MHLPNYHPPEPILAELERLYAESGWRLSYSATWGDGGELIDVAIVVELGAVIYVLHTKDDEGEVEIVCADDNETLLRLLKQADGDDVNVTASGHYA